MNRIEDKNYKTNDKEKGYLYYVKNPETNMLTLCASKSILERGTYVVYPTKYGDDLGIVQYPVSSGCEQKGCNFCSVSESANKDDEDLSWITALATEQEIEHYKKNILACEDAIRICKEKVLELKLNMKIVSAHFMFREPKIFFFFTSSERVDFRALVKNLGSVFKMRIELRQIGTRDEVRLLGGLALCGRDFCCHNISDKLSHVTMKMAKEQNLFKNSGKISGPCGKLLCCLNYEYNFYREERQTYPSEGTKILIDNEFFKVKEVNVLSKTLTLTGTEGRYFNIFRKDIFFSEENHRWQAREDYQFVL